MSHHFSPIKPGEIATCSQCGQTRAEVLASPNPKVCDLAPDAPLAPAQATAAPPDLDVSLVTDSSLITTFNGRMGSAVAISEYLALTAFHGERKVGDTIEVKTAKGKINLAHVVFAEFEPDVVDIAVVKLASKNKFVCFVRPCLTERVRLEQPIHVIGVRETGRGAVDPYSIPSNVLLIESESTLFQASYYNFNGCSGTGVITSVRNNRFEVVGVHVAKHDSTVGIGEKRKLDDLSLGQMQEDIHSMCSDLHGHTAYCLICEVARVPGLVEFLNMEMTTA